jgi:hypothetical protein
MHTEFKHGLGGGGADWGPTHDPLDGNFHLRTDVYVYIHVCVCVKVKVKSLYLTKHHAMKTYWGCRGIAPRIPDLGIRWRWVVSFTPRPLYPQRKSPWYPLDRRLGGPQSRSGRGGEKKNSQSPPGIEP